MRWSPRGRVLHRISRVRWNSWARRIRKAVVNSRWRAPSKVQRWWASSPLARGLLLGREITFRRVDELLLFGVDGTVHRRDFAHQPQQRAHILRLEFRRAALENLVEVIDDIKHVADQVRAGEQQIRRLIPR